MTQPVKFGLNVDPNTGGLAIAERITAIAETNGLDYIGIQDHPYAGCKTLTAVHTDAQMNVFVFWPTGDRERQSRLFAEEVVPAVRESLAALCRVPERVLKGVSSPKERPEHAAGRGRRGRSRRR